MRTIRFSIAALMAVVVVAALGLAALRDASELRAGATFLLTCGVLCVAIVGAVCRTGTERAWWLGFALFGWGYMLLAFRSPFNLPTTALLELLEARVHPPSEVGGRFGRLRSMLLDGGFGGIAGPSFDTSFRQIGHCLLALLAALLGGVLAVILFGRRSKRDENREAQTEVAAQTRRRLRLWPALVIALSGAILIGLLGFFASRSSPGAWAGATFFATWVLLGITILVAVIGQGRGRQVWLGAALFGAGYMILAFGRSLGPETPSLPTDLLLQALKRWSPPVVSGYPTTSPGVAAANARIQEALERPVPMHFDEDTPLEDVLQHIKAATRGPDGKAIPIYVDPLGLMEAEKTMTSTVRNISLDGVELKTSLRLCLKQLDLTYWIQDGLLLITSVESEDLPPYGPDPFLIVGHCLLAWLAAGLGAIVATFVPRGRRESTTPVADGTSSDPGLRPPA